MKTNLPNNRVFSGVQPTGNLHLGNYLGAIKRFVALQKKHQCIYCVVDLHAITTRQQPHELQQAIREVAAAFIASGIDYKKHIVFNQSQVAQHAELAWIFNCIAPMGWLSRMTQFKEKAGKDKEKASVGLYAYPNLMAADILLYRANYVPVGVDQKQHLELTRNIAQKFNHDFKNYFPLTEPLIGGGTGIAMRVMSLRDGKNKMSKSEPSELSRINLTDSNDEIAKKIRKAKTDPHPLPAPEQIADLAKRPEAENLLGIYAALADKDIKTVLQEFGGKEFSALKPALADLCIATLAPIRQTMKTLLEDKGEIDNILRQGAVRAREIASTTIKDVKDILGFIA